MAVLYSHVLCLYTCTLAEFCFLQQTILSVIVNIYWRIISRGVECRFIADSAVHKVVFT